MVTRFEIAVRRDFPDPRGDEIAHKIRTFLGFEIRAVRTRDVYRIDADLTPEEADKVLHEFTDPVLQRGAIGRLEGARFDFAVTVGYKPGVTDPVGKSARVAVEDTLGRKLGDADAVYTSTLYLLEGVDRAGAERIAAELLANAVIETVKIETSESWHGSPPDLAVPRMEPHPRPPVKTVDLSGSDGELMRISRDGLLALSLAEMKAIRDHFVASASSEVRRELGLGADPTDAEVECIAQTWSEHCKHKI
ncbi:MAG: phosphoribosylformylglycinamidine synthase subunit PurS, partial [Acidobacteriota bacterium]|nr:phosphoribosylformylglycinamidine synthase subunit PurS [Acidobacteriota bacterium]